MVDVADRWMCSRLDFEVLKCLALHPHIPAILVLNKVLKTGIKGSCCRVKQLGAVAVSLLD